VRGGGQGLATVAGGGRAGVAAGSGGAGRAGGRMCGLLGHAARGRVVYTLAKGL
jgi:hypothetical protein